MVTYTPALLELTARDLMSRDVVVIPREMSLRAVARLLSRSQISGAPVVDEQGRCIGMLSTTDFVRWTENRPRNKTEPAPPSHACSEWQVLETEDLPTERAEAFMTTDLVTVTPATGISELAQCMLDAHIHRVLVITDLGQPVGIVSSTDVLAAVARAGRP